ncbi:MAG: hypothetical protein E7497_04910 [Ruminococcus sp.]|nr:hypothetical protein [Ruminococcus sp.]
MKNQKKRFCFSAIMLTLIVACSVFYYVSYANYYEGRNTEENNHAYSIFLLTQTSIQSIEESEIEDNFILSSSDKYKIDFKNDNEIYKEMDKWAETNNIDYKNGSYYIEIRNKKVYKVICAKWLYSGFSGSYPNSNTTCDSFKKLADKAFSEFSEECDTGKMVD